MLGEATILHILLLLGFCLAPLMTNKFFLNNSKLYLKVYEVCIIILFISLVFKLNYAVFIWPLFCAFGLALYLYSIKNNIFLINNLIKTIPFVFSIISSVWFVSAVNNLHLLGYNKEWSFYAALHGCFLGWMFIGCLVVISAKEKLKNIYQILSFLCLVLFLFVAFGINGVSHLKGIGVVGFSLIIPFAIGLYIRNLKKENGLSIKLSLISLVSIVLSMTLALMNEFWSEFPKVIFGISTMTLTHGLLNAVLVLPLFMLAIMAEHEHHFE